MLRSDIASEPSVALIVSNKSIEPVSSKFLHILWVSSLVNSFKFIVNFPKNSSFPKTETSNTFDWSGYVCRANCSAQTGFEDLGIALN